MAALSTEQVARARKTFAALANRIAEVGQAPIAEALGCSVSTVSRLVTTDLEQTIKAMTAVGYKMVPVEYRCVDPDEYAQLKKWAIRRLESNDEGDTNLHWDAPR
jgi:hypothetical protein